MADTPKEISGTSPGGLRRLWSRARSTPAAPAVVESTPLAVVRPATSNGKTLVPASAPPISAAELFALFAQAREPATLAAAFAAGVAGLPGEVGDMGRRLQTACAAADWEEYGRAARHLIDKYLRTIPDETPLPGATPPAGEAEQLRDLLHHTVAVALEALLQDDPPMAEQSHAMAQSIKQWQPNQPLAPLAQQLKELSHAIGQRAREASDAHDLMRSLFDLLLENVGELLEDGNWLQGQIAAVRDLLAGPLDRACLEQTRAGLREVIYKQGLLKHGIAESKEAMKEMMVTFVDRLDGMAASTGIYHDRITYHAQAIRNARSVAELGRRMDEILLDTTQVQEQALNARNNLLEARQQVELAEQRIQRLEQELQDVTSLVRVDQLTGALNRRGFDELFKRESTRALRTGQPLCLLLLDVDDFREINARHGHLGGDAALCHLVNTVQATLRGSDAVARFGGEEFVILMPDAPFREAQATATRLLQRISQRPFLHEGQRISITFSAGVACWRPGEPQDALIERADKAMYQAKSAGKNRIVAALE
ncbi:GGDEF domain-containing protein [Pseudoxanthomonas mexicana]|uniref:GGDEF domain-containing protein n=1 Tax=Pseudoxanthomonas mexicana TaxID=128785 RepID=UPI00398AEDE9